MQTDPDKAEDVRATWRRRVERRLRRLVCPNKSNGSGMSGLKPRGHHRRFLFSFHEQEAFSFFLFQKMRRWVNLVLTPAHAPKVGRLHLVMARP